MKTMRTVLPCFGMLVLLAFATTFARAGDTDCTTGLTSCFGINVVGTASGSLSGGGHVASFAETVFKQGSVYTYVFTITNLNTALLDFANTFTNAGLGDNFNCGNGSCQNYGVVTGAAFTTPGKDDTTWGFNPLSLQVGFTTLGLNQKLTFYVQGGAPAPGMIYVGNRGATGQHSSLDPAPLSEPGVLTLLASLLLVLGIPFVGRLRPREA